MANSVHVSSRGAVPQYTAPSSAGWVLAPEDKPAEVLTHSVSERGFIWRKALYTEAELKWDCVRTGSDPAGLSNSGSQPVLPNKPGLTAVLINDEKQGKKWFIQCGYTGEKDTEDHWPLNPLFGSPTPHIPHLRSWHEFRFRQRARIGHIQAVLVKLWSTVIGSLLPLALSCKAVW